MSGLAYCYYQRVDVPARKARQQLPNQHTGELGAEFRAICGDYQNDGVRQCKEPPQGGP